MTVTKQTMNQMKTYTTPRYAHNKLPINKSKQGETIEQKIERIVTSKEPIKDGAPLIYTERKEGIRRSTNIRTDRFEVAIEATDRIQKSYQARREERAKTGEKKKDGETESIQGKETTDKP